ncbi:hypothetical protein HMPREF0880_04429 [Yokenella regensburgei ATCC 43003]|nr:hypothetical protein HMPREF0880_04429 [Yokenella regensburgei ATCC 43003]
MAGRHEQENTAAAVFFFAFLRPRHDTDAASGQYHIITLYAQG